MTSIHERRASLRAGAGDDGFVLPGATAHYPPDLGLEPHHLALDARLAIADATMHATAEWTLRANRAGVRTLTLDAVAFTDIEVADANNTPLRFRYDGQRLQITLADAPEPGDEVRVRVTYRVVAPAGGLYFSAPDNDDLARPLFAATDNETERARYWLPCIDAPAVRTTAAFALRADASLTALANGRLDGEETHDDGTRTTRWALEQPCPSYLLCFVVGDLVRHDDRAAAGVPISYFTTREFGAGHLARAFGRTPDMLEWIVGRLGVPYPYPKYFQFAVPDIGGAMENISLVSWDDRFVLDETLASEWGWLVDRINVHEMAHTWFGDAVVCRDYAHAWLKESWATYIEVVWLEECVSRDEAQYTFYEDAESYFAEADGRYRRPLVTRTFNSSWQMYDMHLYPGGACRLHTLRGELGDDVFWEGTCTYLERYQGKAVETDHFRHVMEEVSGRSLGRFFDQWIHSPGYPSLKVGWAWDDEKSEGTFTIEQTQVDEKAGVGLFDLDLDVGWVIDGELDTRRIRVDAARHEVRVKLERKPDQVRVDPHNRTLLKLAFNPGDDLLRTQLTDAPDVIGRIRAARELAATGRRANIDAIADAWGGEPFWGVRVWFARALRDAGTSRAVEHLARVLREESDPRALEPSFRAAIGVRDEAIRDAIEERVAAGLPYRAAGAAYEAMGSQRREANVDLLLDAANQRTFSGFAQHGAIVALAASRQPIALDAVTRLASSRSVPARVRPAVARALGEAARMADRHSTRVGLVEQLIDLLRDRSLRVRQAAVSGLAIAADTRAIEPLEAYARSVPRQEAVAVERAIQAIRRDAAQPPDAAPERIDKLEQKLRALADTVESLRARLEPEPEPARKKNKRKK
jgi:aminopeptidase N